MYVHLLKHINIETQTHIDTKKTPLSRGWDQKQKKILAKYFFSKTMLLKVTPLVSPFIPHKQLYAI